MRLRQRLWFPSALVFLSSGCIMVIELVASRLIAPRVGVSLYTWTSVIGVILAGISIGNYIGGRLADRYASSALLGLVFALASLSTLSILWLNNDLHELRIPAHAPFAVYILVYIAGVFLLPSLVLGCVSPIIVKLSLKNLQRTGRTVGKIYAWSSVGSIAGTFLTGFVLISALGTKTTVMMVAGLLMLLALWFLTDTTWPRAVARALLLLGLFGGLIWALDHSGFLRSECLVETDYFCINVYETEKDERTVRELLLDRLVHSYSDIDDPTFLAYGYEQTYAAAIEPLARRNPALSAFFIGGGGYTFPRYLETLFPQSHLVVAEIDPGVTEVAYDYMGLPRDTRVETFNMDARNYLARYAAPDSFDVVFGDAFNDFSVPYHLTTLEFDRLVDRALKPHGLYMVNIIDGGMYGRFFRAYVRTLQQVMRYVAVIPSSQDWRTSVRTTFVILGSQEPLVLDGLPPEYQPLGEEELESYLAEEPPLILTDDYVPVDNLIAPVVSASFTLDQVDPALKQKIATRIRVVTLGALVLIVGGCVVAIKLRKRPRSMQRQGEPVD